MTSGFLALLRPNGPWRLGPGSGERDRVDRICHSDTLFSAVSSAMDRLGKLEDWIGAASTASVRISSAFPFQGKTLYVPPPRLCTDNGSMIAMAGAIRLARGERAPANLSPDPGWRL